MLGFLQMGDSNSITADGDMAAESKFENDREGTPSSIESTPEQDGGAEPSQEPAPPQKRKGGRKPVRSKVDMWQDMCLNTDVSQIYATSEERKQRNRQAQAAFRERRTEYIKQLEANIKQNEDTLSTLQQSHRSAADECLMLRYKNSLLERILLEKGVYLSNFNTHEVPTFAGIDVQAELQMKTGSPTLGFQHPAANIPHIPAPQPALQRTAMQRQQARRSGQNYLPKLAPGQANTDMTFQGSPQGHPTPSSHASSPTSLSTRSPMVVQQGGNNTPPTSTVVAQPQIQQFHNFARSSQQPPNQAFQQRQQISPNTQRPGPPQQYHSNSNRNSVNAPMSAGVPGGNINQSIPASQFYPSPFQKHIDQLGKLTPTPQIELCSS